MLKRSTRCVPRWAWAFKRGVNTTPPTPPPPTHFQTSEAPPSYFQGGQTPPKPLPLDLNNNPLGLGKPMMSSQGNITPPLSFTRKLLYTTPLILIIIGMMGVSGVIEKEEISTDIANAIQLGISSENEGNIKDAIDCYLEALQLMNEEGVENVSQIYVSNALRIAQLYEYQGHLDKALAIYEALKDEYIYCLSHQSDYDAFLTENMLNKGIRTSLAIATRFAQLVPPERLEEGKEALLFNIVFAQNRIIEIYPPFLPVVNDINNRNILALLTHDIEHQFQFLTEDEKKAKMEESAQNPIELPLYATDETEENKLLGLHIGGWPIFTKSLMVAKDTLANLCTETGDLSDSISNLVSNSNFIQRSFEHPAVIALTFSKLAIALQMTHEIISRDYPKESIVEVIQDDKPVSVDISKPEIKEFVLNTTAVESERVFKKVLQLCEQAKKTNHNVSTDEMVNKVKKQLDTMFEPAYDKSEMVSSMGLGLIELQRGQRALALQYFRRAKILAVKLKDHDYEKDLTLWIDKIDV